MQGTSFVLVCALGAAFAAPPACDGPVALSACNEAKNGCDWWDGIIQKRCEYSDTGAGGTTRRAIVAIGCKTPGDAAASLVVDGDAVRDGYFGYECDKEGESLTVRPVECYTKDNKRLEAGESHEHDGYIYRCMQDAAANGDSTVKLEREKKTIKCVYNGEEYTLNKVIKSTDGVSALRCRTENGEGVFKVDGCYVGTRKINFWQSRDGKFCQPAAADGASELVVMTEGCEYDGVTYDVYKTWRKDGMYFSCRHRINRNSYLKCLKTEQREQCPRPTYIYTHGCTYNNDKSVVGFNNAVKFNNVFYHCQGTPAQAPLERACNMTEITDTSLHSCKNGEELNKVDTKDNVRFKCRFRATGTYYQYYHCVSADGKNVGRNRVHHDKENEQAFKCHVVNGVLKYTRLSDADYKSWLAGQLDVFVAGGGSGSGNSEETDNAPPSCADGHAYDTEKKQCLDVNECQQGTHNCVDSENCHNLQGSFVCKCKEGLTRVLGENVCSMVSCGCPTDNTDGGADEGDMPVDDIE